MFPQDNVGERLGRYEVVRKLATGGMAEIYLARMRGAAGFEKLCVLKRILPSVAQDERLVSMFLDEARLSATLRHPNIADVFDLGSDRGSYFFAMEFIHGQDARLVRLQAHTVERPIPLDIGIAIVRGVASALAYAHDKVGPDGPLDLVHRDVSPGNVLISYDGAVKLVDFGIARATSRSMETKSGTLKGKIPYMSPEQCQGQRLDRRSDLFSLGIMFYELTVGCRPFRGNSEFAIMERIVNRPPQPPRMVIAGYPSELEAIVLKLLARDRRGRYQTAHEVLADLDAFTEKHRLAVTQLALAKYMRALFPGEVAAWERAAQDGASLAQHLAETAAQPVVRPHLDSPAYGAMVVRLGSEPRSDTQQSIAVTDDDVVQTSDAADPEATVEQRNPLALFEIAAVERKLGIVDDLLSYPKSARIPSRDFTMDDPTHQAKPTDMMILAGLSGDQTSADLVRPFDPIEDYRAEILEQVHGESATGRFEGLIARAWASHEEGEHEKAVVAVELALSEDPDDAVAPEVLERHSAAITAIFESFLGDRTRQPALARQLEDLACLPIRPQAAFLLSRIDGELALDDLLDISGMPRQDACRHLCQLFLLGILQ
jgi:serine/threonine protein kinase